MSNNSNSSPINGKTPELNARMPIRYAACTAFKYFYSNMIWNERGTLTEKDSEFLHYFRVSSKRLRVALSTFRPYFKKSEIRYFKDEIKPLAPVLGRPRDIDVYLELLTKEIFLRMTPGERKILSKYLDFLKDSRKNLQKPVLEKVNSARYLTFKIKFDRFLKGGLLGCKNSASSGIANFADHEISRGIKSLLKLAGKLTPRSSDKRLHEFRIECRKMRYRTELFLSLPGNEAKKLSRKLVQMQNSLGDWHDSVTAGEKLEHYLKANPQFKESPVLRKLKKLQKRRALKYKKKFIRKLCSIKKLKNLL